MRRTYLTAMFAGAWALALALIGLALQIRSAWAWAVLSAIAVAPPLLTRALWHSPAKTMSESIHEARD